MTFILAIVFAAGAFHFALEGNYIAAVFGVVFAASALAYEWKK